MTHLNISGCLSSPNKLYVNGSACFPNDSKLGFHGNPSAATISNYYSGNDTSNYLTMFAGGTERMRIASDGTISTIGSFRLVESQTHKDGLSFSYVKI